MVELRGAVPVAHWMGIAPLKGFIIAVLGNMIPVPLILIFLRDWMEEIDGEDESGSAGGACDQKGFEVLNEYHGASVIGFLDFFV